MTPDQIPLLAALKSRLGYLSQRETLISQNVANSDTPGYTPRDLQPFKLPSGGGGGGAAPLAMNLPAQTGAHFAISPNAANGSSSGSLASGWQAQDEPDSESRLDGNKVVLEEQMMKLNDARSNYDAAISFYEKSMGLLELAIRTPGKGA
jgi:flagellar basal-body rod protein FlgB